MVKICYTSFRSFETESMEGKQDESRNICKKFTPVTAGKDLLRQGLTQECKLVEEHIQECEKRLK